MLFLSSPYSGAQTTAQASEGSYSTNPDSLPTAPREISALTLLYPQALDSIRFVYSKTGQISEIKSAYITDYLNEKGEIKECYFFDCQKVKYKKDYDSGTFKQLVTHDDRVYKDHYINNRKLGRNHK